jgi:hypothetical protein
MYHLKTKRLIRELAKEHNVTIAQAEDVVTTMFEATRYFMTRPEYRETYEFPIIFIPGFCKFYPAEKTVKGIKEANEKKEKEIENESI